LLLLLCERNASGAKIIGTQKTKIENIGRWSM
jgi:hypothetical protein